MQTGRSEPREIVQVLYLMILSRYPTAQEGEVLRDYAQSGKASGPEVLQDLVWALINSAQFLISALSDVAMGNARSRID